MEQLHLVGVHDDGEHLIVETTDSQRYSLKIDQQLRHAVQHARKKSPARGRGSGQFGPRDIQARFRAGATVEDIVAESGWEPERVKRYEWPILAERAHMVREALKVTVTGTSPSHDGYRSVFEGEPRSLEHTVRQQATENGVDVKSLDWDAWQREDQLWTIQLSFTVARHEQAPHEIGSAAEWTYNPANQTIRPANDWARTLGEEPRQSGPLGIPAPAASHAPAPNAQVEQLQREASQADELLDVLQARRGRRLGSDEEKDERLAEILGRGMGHVANRPRPIAAPEDSPLFEQPIQPAAARVAEDRALQENDDIEIVDDSTADTGDAAPAVVDSRDHTPASLPEAVTAGGGAKLTVATQQPSAEHERSAEEHHTRAEGSDSHESDSAPAEQPATEAHEERHTAHNSRSAEDSKPAPGPRGRTSKAKRSSVPSWDEIVFGSQSN